MDNTVAIAAIGLATTTVGGLIWIMKYLANTLSKDLKEHTAAAISQRESSDEVLQFMKNLNGRLEKAAREKLRGK